MGCGCRGNLTRGPSQRWSWHSHSPRPGRPSLGCPEFSPWAGPASCSVCAAFPPFPLQFLSCPPFSNSHSLFLLPWRNFTQLSPGRGKETLRLFSTLAWPQEPEVVWSRRFPSRCHLPLPRAAYPSFLEIRKWFLNSIWNLLVSIFLT